jgi:hypothetical protein
MTYHAATRTSVLKRPTGRHRTQRCEGNGAGDRNRTCTSRGRRLLRPLRLPVPPPRHGAPRLVEPGLLSNARFALSRFKRKRPIQRGHRAAWRGLLQRCLAQLNRSETVHSLGRGLARTDWEWVWWLDGPRSGGVRAGMVPPGSAPASAMICDAEHSIRLRV